jgi:Clp amino terminal domain, pathogenicity island component
MRRPTAPAQLIFARACDEAAQISFALDVEHIVLAVTAMGSALDEYVTPEDVRDLIELRERDALAHLGISLDSVRDELDEALTEPCDLPITPEAKRMFELAARRRSFVTPDQMLATLVHHSERARRFLFELGVPVGTLQERLRR